MIKITDLSFTKRENFPKKQFVKYSLPEQSFGLCMSLKSRLRVCSLSEFPVRTVAPPAGLMSFCTTVGHSEGRAAPGLHLSPVSHLSTEEHNYPDLKQQQNKIMDRAGFKVILIIFDIVFPVSEHCYPPKARSVKSI